MPQHVGIPQGDERLVPDRVGSDPPPRERKSQSPGETRRGRPSDSRGVSHQEGTQDGVESLPAGLRPPEGRGHVAEEGGVAEGPHSVGSDRDGGEDRGGAEEEDGLQPPPRVFGHESIETQHEERHRRGSGGERKMERQPPRGEQDMKLSEGSAEEAEEPVHWS